MQVLVWVVQSADAAKCGDLEVLAHRLVELGRRTCSCSLTGDVRRSLSDRGRHGQRGRRQNQRRPCGHCRLGGRLALNRCPGISVAGPHIIRCKPIGNCLAPEMMLGRPRVSTRLPSSERWKATSADPSCHDVGANFATGGTRPAAAVIISETSASPSWTMIRLKPRTSST